MKIQTFCEDCIFKVGNPQIDCQIGRLNTFIEKGKATPGNAYIIETLCNTKRTQTWKQKHRRTVIDALKEVEIKVDTIILDNHIEVLESINKQSLKANHTYLISEDNKFKEFEIYLSKDITMVRIFDECPLASILSKLSGSYVLILKDPIPKNYIYYINHLINFKLSNFIAIKNPLCLHKSFLTMRMMNGKKYPEILDEVNSLEDKYLQTWPK